MGVRFIRKTLRAALATVPLVYGGVLPATASPILDRTPTGSGTTNSGAVIISGALRESPGGEADVWTITTLAGPDECLRLDVTLASENLDLLVISPDGRLFRNLDRSPTDNKPLVKISGTMEGQYAVVVTEATGELVSTTFDIRIGRFTPATNPNCATPTPPV